VEGEEPEDSKSSISILGNSGTVDGPEIVLRRVPTTAAPAGLLATNFRCSSILASHRLNFRI
jgi:hypothetical protein